MPYLVDILGRPVLSEQRQRRGRDLRERGGHRETQGSRGKGNCSQHIINERRGFFLLWLLLFCLRFFFFKHSVISFVLVLVIVFMFAKAVYYTYIEYPFKPIFSKMAVLL